MLLTAIEAYGFRNSSGRIELGPGLNILWGQNAAGKTSILEAVYLLANTKSFRTSQLREAVTFGGTEAVVRGTVRRERLERELQVRLAGPRKEFYVNGKRESAVEYIQHFDAVVFSFEELGIVRGEPAERRRFLDRGVVGLHPSYLRTISEYNQVLKQKNRLLRDASESTDPGVRARVRELVEPWNAQLILAGTRIHLERTAYVERLRGALADNLFGEPVEVRYRSSFEGKGDLSSYGTLFAERLELRFEAELASGHALIGPHRDDLEILVRGRDVGRFGSAGQQRSALLILDLAQVAVYHSAFDEYPVLLIDDIDAELDRGRIDRLLGYVEGRAQTLISTSKEAIARAYADRADTFLVTAGRATHEGGESVEAPAAADGQSESREDDTP